MTIEDELLDAYKDRLDIRVHIEQLKDANKVLIDALERILPMAEDDVFQYGGDSDKDEDICFARHVLSKVKEREE